jgi:alpha-glucosidase
MLRTNRREPALCGVPHFGQSPIRAATEAGIILAGTDSRRDSEQVGNFIELRNSEGVIVNIIS